MELLITLDALKRASPRRITVVLPYYPYSRSDKKDQPRVPITAKLVADLLVTAGADRVLTCDLHNAAIQGFLDIPSDQLKAKDVLVKYFEPIAKENEGNVVVVATDAGSSKKAYKYAQKLNTKIALIDKRRDGNDDKAIATNVIGDVTGKICMIFDDEIDTAKCAKNRENVAKRWAAKDTTVYERIPTNTNVKEIRHKYGEYQNVLLSDTDYEKLKAEFPTDYAERIEAVSEYCKSSGKSYKDYLATIRAWARRDAKKNKPTKNDVNAGYNDALDILGLKNG